MTTNVLILDANQHSALACTRSLGAKGITVFTCDETPKSLAGQSRYSSGYFRIPSAGLYPDEFISTLRKLIEQYDIGMLLPMSDITCPIILSNQHRFKDILLPLPSLEQYNKVTDKNHLVQHAAQLGIRTPNTTYIHNINDLKDIPNFKFPVVIKPSRSRMQLAGQWLHTRVCYAHTSQELESIIEGFTWFPEYPFMIQEFIEGHGTGIFILYDQGNPITYFSHKRIREKPPSGGVSVLCESVRVDKTLKEIADILLARIRWNGVAMIELVTTPEGIPYLIEINARFWGSLQLAIDSGVDFPWLLYQMTLGDKPEPIFEYQSGNRLHWLMGDLERLYLVYRGQKESPANLFSETKDFLFPGFHNTHKDICRLTDPVPGFFEIAQYIWKLADKLRRL